MIRLTDEQWETSGSIIDGPGQEGAIAGRPAHDHWMNSPQLQTHTAHYSPAHPIGTTQARPRHARALWFFCVSRVERDSDNSRARERLASNLDPFGGELELAHENAGHIAAGM
jgi:hypothetical protein